MAQFPDPIQDVGEELVLRANRVALQAFVEADAFGHSLNFSEEVITSLRNGVYYRTFEAYMAYWMRLETEKRPPLVA